MEIDSPNTFKQMLRTVLYTESLIRHSLEAEDEYAKFHTKQHKKQIEAMRKRQDAENFKKLWETPFTVLKKNMESLIKTKQAEREKHLLEKHKDDAIRAGQGAGGSGDKNLLSGALVALRGRPSTASGDFKEGDRVGVRAWCSSLVFERGVRAWCTSAKRENFNHTPLYLRTTLHQF
jgi:hypothetical protein